MEYSVKNIENCERLAFEFVEFLTQKGLNKPVFLCVGNSNVVGDLFGPLCGEILKTRYNFDCVFGDLKNNVTANNLVDVFNKIKQKFPLSPICVIDSNLCNVGEVGNIKFLPYGCLPAYNSNTKIMGECCMLANINVSGVTGMMFLKTVKFDMVVSMCNFVCCAINRGLQLTKIIQNISNKKVT